MSDRHWDKSVREMLNDFGYKNARYAPEVEASMWILTEQISRIEKCLDRIADALEGK